MKKLLIILYLLIPLTFWAQYLLPNEEVIYSFETKNGKKMSLVKDKTNKYIQYRFGTKTKVEMEFPAKKTKESWKQFTYNSYHRGGGKQNAGMDLNYLFFKNNNYKYLIFKTYHAEDESFSTGITITDIKGKETEITGLYKTHKGCMCYLDDTEVKKEDFGL
ncbi:hypothetical protein [Chryseobacterium balustinum]|uniref:DUF4412 domain-containing protein n=1 Tax=Chryseobacterium balustinum TaxID=246 RepID=A0AAX2IH98_9FLAO|nr:hypothetical protein [Chryseobacterium balustinum]AZB31671.1 hypothetical protein EB354_21775 [Chryseobacterium balustinum]SKB84842.1 hypothetical protein SAMN05421800_110125 [Chryseobacterium balustinum]SQA86968.1 Uncharacterised protein [Chryseobacterium balustinum]